MTYIMALFIVNLDYIVNILLVVTNSYELTQICVYRSFYVYFRFPIVLLTLGFGFLLLVFWFAMYSLFLSNCIIFAPHTLKN